MERLDKERDFCIACNNDYGCYHYMHIDGPREQCKDCKLTMEKFNKYCSENDWMTEFDNKWCDDDCHGWNGKNSRCECRNRRLRWDVYYENDDLIINYYAY